MNNREYGIDLLRLFATLGVITLHIFGIEFPSEGGGELIIILQISFVSFVCAVLIYLV